MGKNRLLIALDYGTTYTGVAFFEFSNTNTIESQIHVIQDWPAAHSNIATKEKVPSEIAYHEKGVSWGSQIQPHVHRHMWTKLELDPPGSSEAKKIRQENMSTAYGNGGGVKGPVDVIADFLREVKQHVIKSLDNQYGKELWQTLPITLVVTVPAVWSDAAKNLTLLAVSRAGFNSTELPQLKHTVTATEPEAAATYTIKSLRGTVKDEHLVAGDGFVVCDMGGGTVDLISYRVAGIKPTVIEEATIGTGDQCGGSFVDRAFLQWLETKLGTEDFIKIAGCDAQDLSRTCLPKKLARMVQDFTMTAKSGFLDTQEYYVRLPNELSSIDDEERGVCDGEICISAYDMKQIYERVLSRTQELVIQQLHMAGRDGKTKVKYVFTVGGFAASPYMYRKISELVQARGVEAIRPTYAWSAIVRGAAAKGMEVEGEPSVKTRKCRRHYGTPTAHIFQKTKHQGTDAYICEYTGKRFAGNQADWLIEKGQDLSTSASFHGELSLSEHFWPKDDRKTTIHLLSTDVDKAPQRSKDPVVKRVAKLHVDLTQVPEIEFRKRRNSFGELYHELDFVVHISVQSTLEFSMSVNGVRYGSLMANYD